MSITLTENAAAEIKRFREEQKFDDDMLLRIGLAGGGCSGFGYSMGFDTQYDRAADSQYDCHGIKVVVDRKHALYLDGATVDWRDEQGQRGFAFDNPNVVRSCGCGGGSCH